MTAAVLAVDAHEAIRKAKMLGAASLFATAAARVLIDDAKIAWLEYRLSSPPAG